MNPLIDQGMVNTIWETGQAFPGLPSRKEALSRLELPVDQPAENVIITGCQVIHLLPDEVLNLARLMERGGLSLTLLSREYCCGNYLFRPAIAARDESSLEECRRISRQFLSENLKRARGLGARRLVILCSPCYPLYRHAFPDEDIVFYPRVLLELLEGGRLGKPSNLPRSIDYYAGCYRLHRKLANVPMDLEAADGILERFPDMEVNRIPAPRCCFTEEGLRHLEKGVKTDLLITVCTGCYGQALGVFPPGGEVRTMLIPGFLARSFQV